MKKVVMTGLLKEIKVRFGLLKEILRLGVRLLIVKLIIRNFLQMVWLDV